MNLRHLQNSQTFINNLERQFEEQFGPTQERKEGDGSPRPSPSPATHQRITTEKTA